MSIESDRISWYTSSTCKQSIVSKHLKTRSRKEAKQRPPRKTNGRGFSLGHELGIPLWIAFCVGIAWVYSSWVRQSNTDVTIVSSIERPEPVKRKPLELPPTGVLHAAEILEEEDVSQVRVFLRAPVDDDESPLSASCVGSESVVQPDYHRFIQVVDWDSHTVVATAFVRAGEMVAIPLPSGSYKLRYADGRKWYGEQEMFGSKYMYEMTERFSSEAVKLQFSRFTSGTDIGTSCLNADVDKKRVKNDALPAQNQEI
ncbi:MAG: hypothetical protein SWY16_13750 [Cyanobacteriota bacterium]|nr:hypothetical protein [Cyanobacteriota bacterium]